MYYPCSENKGADQLRVFVFAYADCWFSHEVAQLYTPLKSSSDAIEKLRLQLFSMGELLAMICAMLPNEPAS